jgi:LemA protein
MTLVYCLLFIFILIGAIAILWIYEYNQIQHSKTKINQAECLIDESLRDRYDLLVNADNLLKEVLDSKTLFKDLNKIKDENISNFDLDRKLNEYVGILLKVKNDNKELNDNKAFKDIISSNKKIDEKLQAAKSYYNKYTSELNDLIRAFPSNIVARIHGIPIQTFFDGKNLEDTIIDDFKL